MPSPFHGIELASRALRAFQRGLDVTGHNIANVNTRGYSRQTVDFVATDPTSFYGLTSLTLGTGVTIAGVNRIRDIFLDNRMFSAGSDQSRYQTLQASLSQIEPSFNEPGSSGISAALNGFFNAWSGLASNPNEPAARMAVQQAGNTLATRIRTAFRDMQGLKTQFGQSVGASLNDVDKLSQRIYDLNAEIRARSVSGETPGDLMDQRDLAVEDLSKIIDVSVQRRTDGTLSIFTNGFALVDDVKAYPIPRTFDPSTFTLTNGSRTITLQSGAVYGAMEAINRINAYQGELDTLANTLRTEINAAHMSGTNPNGTTGILFFNDVATPPQTGAADFDLSADVKADIRNIASGTSGSAGDGSLALAIAQFRDQKSTLLGNRKYSEFYGNLVATIGQDSNDAQARLDTQNAIITQIDQQRQSISGVSVDDEMSNLMRFQRSYQAAAKALSIFDKVTEDLINMI